MVDIMNLMYDLMESTFGTREEYIASHQPGDERNGTAYDLIIDWYVEDSYAQASMLVEKYGVISRRLYDDISDQINGFRDTWDEAEAGESVDDDISDWEHSLVTTVDERWPDER